MFDTQRDFDRSEKAAQDIVQALQDFSHDESLVILQAVRNMLDEAASRAYLDEKARQEGDGE